MPSLWLVDGSHAIFRAYHALPHLSTRQGVPTNAVYGFTTMLLRAIREGSPSHFAVAFDEEAKAKRSEIYAEYKATRGVTMLLTSHYMRDVEALCARVLVITHGRLVYDGPLAGITERFGRHKLVKLQFEGEEAPADLGRFGEFTASGPVAELKVDRTRVAEVLAAILDRYTVVDMSVQDPPLDQVIARVFEEGRARHEALRDGD